MQHTPSSLLLRIGICGRTNTGKSSLLNMITGQNTAITSAIPGTTTDVVAKRMELSPLGPVVFLDTAGIDDLSQLGKERVKRTMKRLGSIDIALIVLEGDVWTEFEDALVAHCKRYEIPMLLVVNKCDLSSPSSSFLAQCKEVSPHLLCCSTEEGDREGFMSGFKRILIALCPDEFLHSPPLLGDLLPSDKEHPLIVCLVPIDLGAPKGRLILPQVQAIRDGLDNNASLIVLKEDNYVHMLSNLKCPPDLVICDSQIVAFMVQNTPPEVPCTTFSILFSRFKGDIVQLAKGAGILASLKAKDAVLIAEACSHHPSVDDIGRVKIPRWIATYCDPAIEIIHCAGSDYPEALSLYRLIIHCGGCTLNRREMLWRMEQARQVNVPITNYGMAISVLHGVAERTLSPFPQALDAYRQAIS
ncbi:[FeFe] hydrogenase H-cluster maturation GTPase HydF [Sphaerochaeta halotolerans]|uniref:[FeFe] hydrogenase H-cluster maturation GTPase HydF n=1 Tax=Sphaerochaeta halotolerans TaxID=2293840 RepID=A0A372MDJ4_9SPIR|nr:[FeFe] hydrogenase H-cluster maturation GTPase HydF [Sphaerochaeta halotolerans]RFU93875.1 [FeFe] hydrogenase H-cluster maturation GTPase HydF [Sphaerochaeta halotolerans]